MGHSLQGRPSGKPSHVRCDAVSGSQFRTYRHLKGDTIGNGKFKVHLDGYDQLRSLTGQQSKANAPIQRRRRGGGLPPARRISGAGTQRFRGEAQLPLTS
jgi:hypothetical protein